jgi:hypothetical protein
MARRMSTRVNITANRPCRLGVSIRGLSPWYHGLKPVTHYKAHIPGTKTDDCTPEARHPECTICRDEQNNKRADVSSPP